MEVIFLNLLFLLMIVISVISASFLGTMGAVSNALIGTAATALELMITIGGGIILWGGIMEIAKVSGLTTLLSKTIEPFLLLIFKGMKRGSEEIKAISMNVIANLLGLGGAATPLGLAAMEEMDKKNPHKGTATKNMILFVVMNTASIQLVPTTIGLLRLQSGSENPFEIIPAVLLVSLCSVSVGLILAKVLHKER